VNDRSALSRRDFLKAGTLALAGLVIGFVVPGARRGALAQPPPSSGLPVPNAFLHIGSDDRVTILLAHVEMGQGVWTTLPMLIAEELDADWSKIQVQHAPAAPAYVHLKLGMQATGGSTSVASEFERYRQAGALARALLLEAAAQRLGVPAAACRTELGVVTVGAHRIRYGALAEAAARLPLPQNVTLKDPKHWRIIGKATRRLDAPEKVNGRAQFGIDVQLPGLLTALIARPPVFGARVRGFDPAAALAVPGVRQVLAVPEAGVAVVAEHFWAAKRGRDALTVDWDLGANASLDSAALRARFLQLADTPGAVAAKAGNPARRLARAKQTIAADYAVPYLAHATMEPLNCTVRIGADRCELWTGTQFQTLAQMTAAQITGLKPEQVELHTTFLGGGFGRRGVTDSHFIAEAVHLAKAVGQPVKTVWTREDDIRGGYYRPAFLHRAQIALGSDGLPRAWTHRLVGQSIATGTPLEPMLLKDGIDQSSVEGVADSPYLKEIAHYRVELHSPRTGIPVWFWRSVGHNHTAFVMESLVDELALAAGQDPVAYRRRLLKGHPRHLGVLDLAAAQAGWGKPLPAGQARGIAVHESFGSVVAQVAEVSVADGQIRVQRVVCAVDCGLAVNPEGVRAQMESGIVYGLAPALYSRLRFKDGRVQESNFHDYRVLRLNEMPRVEVHIVPSTGEPSGAGEPGTPPIAPAVANAVAALTGQRLRELPLSLST